MLFNPLQSWFLVSFLILLLSVMEPNEWSC